MAVVEVVVVLRVGVVALELVISETDFGWEPMKSQVAMALASQGPSLGVGIKNGPYSVIGSRNRK